MIDIFLLKLKLKQFTNDTNKCGNFVETLFPMQSGQCGFKQDFLNVNIK